MKTLNLKFMAIALMAGMTMLTACSSDDDNNGNGDNGGFTDGSTLKGEISSDVTLPAHSSYKLSGELRVKNGATLHIQEGVTITAQSKDVDDVMDYILVEQGGKINAVGTASNPIVMTATTEEPGAWGGIHICGRAKINVASGKSEIGDEAYGGDDDSDNSGKLQYVRVEYAGYIIGKDKEANGFTFYGVGNGTTVDHCEAYKGSDDGFEFFGGSVNVSHLVSVSNSDDSFDWTEGWRGTATNLVAYQEAQATLGYTCDRLIEADNHSTNLTGAPISHPTLSHLILVGANSEGNDKGITLRAGTQVEISNCKVYGDKAKGLTVETEETETALKNGDSMLTNVVISTSFSSKEGIYTEADFLAAEGNKVNETTQATLSFSDIKTSCPWMNGAWVK